MNVTTIVMMIMMGMSTMVKMRMVTTLTRTTIMRNPNQKDDNDENSIMRMAT